MVVEPDGVPTVLLGFYCAGWQSKFAGSVIRILLATKGQSSCDFIFCNESRVVAMGDFGSETFYDNFKCLLVSC